MQVPAAFEYERATSVEHALTLLAKLGPEARILAGGHSLLPMMKLRLAAPEALVDIDPLHEELGYIREADGVLEIGAMVRHRELLESELLAEKFPIFIDAERVIADPIVRNRGTIGGALCQADPAEDLSAVCAALGATASIRGMMGTRVIGMTEFHRGPYETAVGPKEILTEFRIPIHEGASSAYEKVERRVGDWAVVASGAFVRLDSGSITQAGIALTAVGGDFVSIRAQDSLVGKAPTEEAFAQAAAIAAEDCRPAPDQRGTVEYKRHLAKELTHRALRRAAARALEKEA